MTPRTSNARAFAALATAGCLWGTGFLFGKWALTELSVRQYVLYRFLFASIGFAPITWHALRNPATRAYVHVLLKLVPRPDIAFLLDADPVQARARKPEYPPEFLQSSRASYLALAQSTGMSIIEPLAPEVVARSILNRVPRASLLSAAGRGRLLLTDLTSK